MTSMQLLDSKEIVDGINNKTKAMSAELIDAGINFHLALVLVGDDIESLKYVHLKIKKGKELGVLVSLYHLEEKESFEQVQETLRFLNQDEEITGIVLQLPLPSKFTNEQRDLLLKEISPEKDVDALGQGWKSYTVEEIADSIDCRDCGVNCLLPPIFLAVYSILKDHEIELKDQKIVMVGNGALVGVPINGILNKLGYSCQVVDKETDHILDITKGADILITGTGQKDLVTYQWITEGATVVSCSADIHYDSVSQIAKAVTPTTGGIGPLTVAWLLNNTVRVVYQKWKCQIGDRKAND